jgi:hypothetical protein
MITDVREGDVVRMKRRHPCGGWEWTVYRTGADIGIECQTCHRRVMLERRKFESRARSVVARDG